MKKLLFIIIFLMSGICSQAQLTKQLESYYQKNFVDTLRSKLTLVDWTTVKTEFVLQDQTRADIVTKDYAIEVEFASKWKNSIGQTMHYTKLFDDLDIYKKGGILLIVNGTKENNYNNTKDGYYLQQLVDNAYKLNFTIWTVDYNTNKWKKIKMRVVYE